MRLRCNAKIQTILEGMQGVEGVVERLVLFNGIAAGSEQLAGASDDGFFGICNAGRDPLFLALKQGCGVKLAPASHANGGWGWVVINTSL